MEIEFNLLENARNIDERGLSFEQVREFDFETALYVVDDRHDYGETRIRALGFVGPRLHVLVFVEVPKGIRVISFRKANKREVIGYGKAR